MTDKIIYWTERNHLLSYWGFIPDKPTVCCELYCKWYTLHVIMPDGTVQSLCYLDLPEGPIYEEGDPMPAWAHVGTPKYPAFIDHEPHPLAVAVYVQKMGWELCDYAEELILMRWLTHVDELDTEEILERITRGST